VMQVEHVHIQRNETWDLVELCKGESEIDASGSTKQMFSWQAQGKASDKRFWMERIDWEEAFACVTKNKHHQMNTSHSILFQVDHSSDRCQSAFLNGYLEEEVYI
jgi:hypothetical protein